jgi:tryptophanyl-tRNA synthetase
MKKKLENFGLESPDYELLSLIDKNDLLVSRKLIRKVRGKEELEKAIKSKNFYVLTGIMPSYEKIHFGTYGVIALVKFFQKVSKVTIVCVADVESYLTRNISLQKTKEISYNEHIPAYLSLGLDENKTIFISNQKIQV